MSKARNPIPALLLLLFSSSPSLLLPTLAAHHPHTGIPLQSASSAFHEVDELEEAGFSSLDGMLHWAISHSDPTKLKEKAHGIEGSSKDKIIKIQLEMKETLEKLKMPSDTELMQAAIADLNNSSISSEDLYRALDNVLMLVESLTNAKDLSRLGGLTAVIRELCSRDTEIRMISAWILGKASQNYPDIQKQVTELGALPTLMKMVKSSSSEEALKALYAISAVVSNNPPSQDLFYSEAGELMLLDLLNDSSTDVKLLRKSASLVADLAQFKIENCKEEKHPSIKISLMKSLVNVATSSNDLDLQEKALMGIRNLLELLLSTKVLEPSDYSDLDQALLKMEERLDNLQSDDQTEYASDIRNLIDSIRGELKNPF